MTEVVCFVGANLVVSQFMCLGFKCKSKDLKYGTMTGEEYTMDVWGNPVNSYSNPDTS